LRSDDRFRSGKSKFETRHTKEFIMKVDVRCFATLANEGACDYRSAFSYELDEGQTVGNLAEAAGVDAGKVKIAFVNGRIRGFNTKLSHGDRVGFAPAVGGM
jgi:molybdopterin converting factor small subunit